MYKILILKRDSKTEPLWTVYKIVNQDNTLSDFETVDEIELSSEINKLLSLYPKDKIFPIKNMSYMVDVIVSDD